MADEIERRWLLKKLPPAEILAADPNPMKFTQGYLPSGGTIHERVTMRLGKLANTYTRTVKIGHGLVRHEYKEDIPESVFNELWPLTQGRRLHKRRYTLHAGVVDGIFLKWEITEFLDRPMVLAEIEIPNVDLIIAPPPWLLEIIEREVTDDVNFEAWVMGK